MAEFKDQELVLYFHLIKHISSVAGKHAGEIRQKRLSVRRAHTLCQYFAVFYIESFTTTSTLPAKAIAFLNLTITINLRELCSFHYTLYTV